MNGVDCRFSSGLAAGVIHSGWHDCRAVMISELPVPLSHNPCRITTLIPLCRSRGMIRHRNRRHPAIEFESPDVSFNPGFHPQTHLCAAEHETVNDSTKLVRFTASPIIASQAGGCRQPSHRPLPDPQSDAASFANIAQRGPTTSTQFKYKHHNTPAQVVQGDIRPLVLSNQMCRKFTAFLRYAFS